MFLAVGQIAVKKVLMLLGIVDYDRPYSVVIRVINKVFDVSGNE